MAADVTLFLVRSGCAPERGPQTYRFTCSNLRNHDYGITR